MDVVRYGTSTQKSWLDVIGQHFDVKPSADQTNYSQLAVNPKPACSLNAYVGTYRNSPYRVLTVSIRSGPSP